MWEGPHEQHRLLRSFADAQLYIIGIERFHPSFAIASYHIKDNVQTRPRLEEMLRAHGYTTVTEYPHQTTYAFVPGR